ncbi:MAG: endonuclease I/PKD repeat protein [Paraglaciecola sp.]
MSIVIDIKFVVKLSLNHLSFSTNIYVSTIKKIGNIDMPLQTSTALRSSAAMLLLALSASALSAVPANYYNSADTSTAETLASSLHNIINDHTRFPYTSTATDTWDVLELADEDPNNVNNVIDLYLNASYAKEGGGNSFYNREHSWPKSYGFPSDGATNYPYTDMHHLFISNSGYNSSRSNKPYANCDGCAEKVTVANDGRGGGAGESSWTTGSCSTGSWETWAGRKGDVARALMYMSVRYDGGNHGITGAMEPDLILTDDRNLIGSSNAGSNITVAYMGLRSVLLQWSTEDPVDSYELRHNDTVFNYQGNRNPFVDHPEYVDCIFANLCSGGGDEIAPAMPDNLSASGGAQTVALAWSANSESDLAGYNVYRSDTSGGSFIKLNGSTITSNAYNDNNVLATTTYYYMVSALDTSNNESSLSSEVFGTTDGTPPSVDTAWINELHYDNASSDTGESVEIAGTAGLDLSGWQLIAYNGNGGASYKTISLAGTLANQQNGFGTLSFAAVGLQNGAPDGIALIDATGTVVEFISYEGTFTATDGAAFGMTSVDIGVSETSATPVGDSLQRAGSGQQGSDFSWQAATTNSMGLVNAQQSFTGGAPANQLPTAVIISSCNNLICSFDAGSSSDPDGSIVAYAWDFGDSNSSAAIAPEHNYSVAGSYTVQLTITDNAGGNGATSTIVEVIDVPSEPWINELHYDNSGSDSNESIEIAGQAGTDLSNWRMELYNGSNSQVYKTVNLSGTLGNQQNGFGTLNFAISGLQNGAPDGVALIDNNNVVIQFLSYEGSLVAQGGAADGLTATDIGVAETSSTQSGHSLQLSGIGQEYSDFSWQSAASHTRGMLNNGQSF